MDGGIFCIPHEFLLIDKKMTDPSKTRKVEEVILDLRNEIQKANSKNKSCFTFNVLSNIWEDRPKIIAQKKTDLCNWKATIYLIKKTNQVLFIKPSHSDAEPIELCFYDANRLNKMQSL